MYWAEIYSQYDQELQISRCDYSRLKFSAKVFGSANFKGFILTYILKRFGLTKKCLILENHKYWKKLEFWQNFSSHEKMLNS